MKLCLGVILAAALGWASDQMTWQQAAVAVLGGMYGVFNRLGTLKVENELAPPPEAP